MRAVGVGLLGYWFARYTDFAGLEYISAQFERLILFTYPLFVVLFGAAFFGQPMRLRTVAAIAVSYIGLAVIFTDKLANMGSNAAIGAGFVLAAAIAFAFYQLLAKPVIAVMGPRLFTCIAMTGAAVSTFVQFLLTHPVGDLAVSPRVLALALFLAIGATVVPTFFLNAALHRFAHLLAVHDQPRRLPRGHGAEDRHREDREEPRARPVAPPVLDQQVAAAALDEIAVLNGEACDADGRIEQPRAAVKRLARCARCRCRGLPRRRRSVAPVRPAAQTRAGPRQ